MVDDAVVIQGLQGSKTRHSPWESRRLHREDQLLKQSYKLPERRVLDV